MTIKVKNQLIQELSDSLFRGILRQPFLLLDEARLVWVGPGSSKGGFGQMAKSGEQRTELTDGEKITNNRPDQHKNSS